MPSCQQSLHKKSWQLLSLKRKTFQLLIVAKSLLTRQTGAQKAQKIPEVTVITGGQQVADTRCLVSVKHHFYVSEVGNS